MPFLGGGSLLRWQVSAFTVPTPPTPSAVTKPLYAPNLTTGPTGKCPYRPWVSAVVDGIVFFCNGWDNLWWWDESSAFNDAGSVVPLTGGVADSATGTAHAITTAFAHYIVFRNSTTLMETAPQLVEWTMGATKDATVTWTDPLLHYDKAAIYRRLQASDTFKLVATVDITATTYEDATSEATLQTSTKYTRRYRETKPPVFKGITSHLNKLWGWTSDDPVIYYSQTADPAGEFLPEDFPSANLLQIGINDGYGEIIAAWPHYASMFVWKRRAVYEVQGDNAANFVVRRLFSDRGCIAQRTLVAVEGLVYFLDEQGLYAWMPGAEPVIAGAAGGTLDSPLAPVWDRLNLDAADLFFAYHNEEDGLYCLCVALDYDLVPNDWIIFDYRRNRFVRDDTRWGTAGGWLEDSGGEQHLCRVDDLGYLHEDDTSNSEGVYSGTTTGTVTTGSLLSLTASAATFDTTAYSGAPGSPLDRYDSTGTVIDTNRVAAATGTVLTMLYVGQAAVTTDSDTLAIGVIPALFQTGKINFGNNGKKIIDRVILEYDIESAGVLRIDTAPDDEAFVNQQEIALSAEGRAIVPCDDRGWDWNLRGVMRLPAFDFALHAMTIEWFVRRDRT